MDFEKIIVFSMKKKPMKNNYDFQWWDGDAFEGWGRGAKRPAVCLRRGRERARSARPNLPSKTKNPRTTTRLRFRKIIVFFIDK